MKHYSVPEGSIPDPGVNAGGPKIPTYDLALMGSPPRGRYHNRRNLIVSRHDGSVPVTAGGSGVRSPASPCRGPGRRSALVKIRKPSVTVTVHQFKKTLPTHRFIKPHTTASWQAAAAAPKLLARAAAKGAASLVAGGSGDGPLPNHRKYTHFQKRALWLTR